MNLTTEPDPPGDCAAFQPRGYGSGENHLFATTDLEKSYRINLNMTVWMVVRR